MIETFRNSILQIDKSNWTPVRFGDVVFEPKENSKDPVADGIEHVVGLEHIDPEDIHLRKSAGLEESTTFTKKFRKGDVLFGKRRAYLKKAAIADFNGLCSSDILVLRANEDKILKELLPFYTSGDTVFEFAVSNAAGSLSPRTKWKDLSKFPIQLPDLRIQENILKVLSKLEETRLLCKNQSQTLKQLKQKLLDEILG